jgi:dGTP triphosphohydrolase
MNKFFIYFFLFFLVSSNVNAADNWVGDIFDKIKDVFDSEQKIIDGAYKDLEELNRFVLVDDQNLIKNNQDKYIRSLEIVKSDVNEKNPEDELENVLRLRKWHLEYEFNSLDKSLSSELLNERILEIEELLELKQKQIEIKIKALENQDDRAVQNMVRVKKRNLGVEEIERDLLSRKVFFKFEFLKNKKNENVSVAKALLNQIDENDFEEGEELLEQVENLSYE